MKVGIIVHSHTGNTLAVAEGLNESFLSAGHSVELQRVTAVNEDPSAAGNIQLMEIPEIIDYDLIIFGAPVRAFSLSSVMRAYLTQLASLQGRKVSCFVTQHFPYPWMGGSRAIRQMKKVCEEKNAEVIETAIVNWSNKNRENMINGLVEKFSKYKLI